MTNLREHLQIPMPHNADPVLHKLIDDINQALGVICWRIFRLPFDGTLGAPGHLTVIDNLDGTATLRLAETYEDLQFSVATGKTPATHFPNFEAFTTNTAAYSFAVDDYIDCGANELVHSWQEGSRGDAHMHITLKAANATGASRYAKFTLYFAYTKTNGVWAESPLSAELTIPNGSLALTNFYLDMGDLTFTDYKIGTQIRVRVKRITATGGVEYASSIFITQVGVHLLSDTRGSQRETTK